MSMKIDLKPDQTCIKEVDFWKSFYSSGLDFAVMDLTRFINADQWIYALNATKRYEYRRSMALNYASRGISMAERNLYLQDIFEINTSSLCRQGRKMDENYLIFPIQLTDNEQCRDHYTQFFGCFLSKKMVAYSNIHVVGEIAAVSMLLGHSWHQKKAGIMVNLFHAIIQYLIDRNVKYLIYHHAYGGTLGLQEFKRSLSFFPNTLEII